MMKKYNQGEEFESRRIIKEFVKSPDQSVKEFARLIGLDGENMPNELHQDLEELRYCIIKNREHIKSSKKFLEESVDVFTNMLVDRNNLSKTARKKALKLISKFKKALENISITYCEYVI